MDSNKEVIFNGCKFYNRCPFGLEMCKDDTPTLMEVEEEHFVACHLL